MYACLLSRSIGSGMVSKMSLIMIVQAARNALCSEEVLVQTSEDWAAIDLEPKPSTSYSHSMSHSNTH